MYTLPEYLHEHYANNLQSFEKTLQLYASIPKSKYFYELCYCICTPQSSAKNAEQVQIKLEQSDFFNVDLDPTDILSDRSHYIRFHNQKSIRLQQAKHKFPLLLEILDDDISNFEKRNKIADLINGIGLKESSHFLRNIGYRNLAIIDRHLLKHLVKCNVISSIPQSISKRKYLEIENDFIEYGNSIGISIDYLDLLFWSYETGFVLK